MCQANTNRKRGGAKKGKKGNNGKTKEEFDAAIKARDDVINQLMAETSMEEKERKQGFLSRLWGSSSASKDGEILAAAVKKGELAAKTIVTGSSGNLGDAESVGLSSDSSSDESSGSDSS